MKKKNAIILSVTAGVVVVGLAVGLGVGLGLRNKDDDNGGEDAHAAYTVTKEEWEAAFDFTDKNCTVQVSYCMPGDSEYNGAMLSARFLGEQNAWLEMEGTWQQGPAEDLSGELNEGYSFFASKAYNFFAYDETTQSYKSTRSWYLCWNEEGETGEAVEDPAQFVGEIKFEDKKLVFCAITLNGSKDARGTYTTTVSDYGTTVKPAEAPAEEE